MSILLGVGIFITGATAQWNIVTIKSIIEGYKPSQMCIRLLWVENYQIINYPRYVMKRASKSVY